MYVWVLILRTRGWQFALLTLCVNSTCPLLVIISLAIAGDLHGHGYLYWYDTLLNLVSMRFHGVGTWASRKERVWAIVLVWFEFWFGVNLMGYGSELGQRFWLGVRVGERVLGRGLVTFVCG